MKCHILSELWSQRNAFILCCWVLHVKTFSPNMLIIYCLPFVFNVKFLGKLDSGCFSFHSSFLEWFSLQSLCSSLILLQNYICPYFDCLAAPSTSLSIGIYEIKIHKNGLPVIISWLAVLLRSALYFMVTVFQVLPPSNVMLNFFCHR